MKKLSALLVVLGMMSLAVVHTGCAAEQLGEKGKFERVSFPSGAETRDFGMLVPENYDPAKPVGVVLGFHGNHGNFSSRPSCDFLSFLDPEAERGYVLLVSVATHHEAQGWHPMFNPTVAPDNTDVQAVDNLLKFLKQHYNIDDNRIYATGFSLGGFFCTTLTNTLVNRLAAIAPIVPANSAHSPTSASKTTCIAFGGNTDSWQTVQVIQGVAGGHLANGTDGEFYAYDMSHSFPPDNDLVYPPKPFSQGLMDYFMLHPRASAAQTYVPMIQANPFRDDFDAAGRAPSSAKWDVLMFKPGKGLLYGAATKNGGRPNDVFGYKFVQKEGHLASVPVGTGAQGGLCITPFAPLPQAWETSFVIDALAPDLSVIPILITEPTGRVMALRLHPQQWEWQSAITGFAFRLQSRRDVRAVASGPLSLEKGKEYRLKARVLNELIDWSLYDGEKSIAWGKVEGPVESMRFGRLGMGLTGTDAAVRFASAELGGITAP